MRDRRRIAFALIVVVCAAVSGGVVLASGEGDRDGGPASAKLAAAIAGTADGSADAAVIYRSLGDPPGRIAGSANGASLGEGSLRCERLHVAGGTGVCVRRPRGFAQGFEAHVFGADERVRHRIPINGVPSRVRVSPDGRLASVTTFVEGHSYAADGAFSTETALLDLRAGRRITDLERFTVYRDGRPVTAEDANFWGVTFGPDGDRFHATLATGGRTYLIAGSVGDRTASTLRENVECPSLSPDGTRIAFKHRVADDPVRWRLTVLNLATMRETPLAETRSVDDQAEWLDEARVLYGVDGAVWSAQADGGGEPERLLAAAASPAVLR